MNLRNIFKGKDKKTIINFGAAFLVGIMLIMFSNSLFMTGIVKKPVPEQNTNPQVKENDYEAKIEKRLSSILSQVDGAGVVNVMVTLKQGKEIVVAEDSNYERIKTTEKDGEGGDREIDNLKQSGTKIIIKGSGGVDEPLIIKEIVPKIEGVIIVAKGGGNVLVKEQLIRATQTVLGVEPHKVQVLKLKDL